MSDAKVTNKKIEEEQERKLRERMAGKLTEEKKRTAPAFLKQRKAYFDSADYNMKGKVDDPSKKTIPKVVKKGEAIASARHLTPLHTDEEVHLKELTDEFVQEEEDDEEVEEEEEEEKHDNQQK